jgi:hypothetical protein
MKQISIVFFAIFYLQKGVAQQIIKPEADQKYKLAIVFGLNQPIVTNGFNVELNYYTKHMVFDYSHGFNLKIRNKLVSEQAKNQHLKFNISHSLGFGIGYRITPELNIRIEPKLHIWEVFYEKDSYEKKNRIQKYNTFTLGLGTYYRWLPFKNSDNFAKGISVIPSFRWWPNIQTSLKDDKFEYFNKITSKNKTHVANNIGVANSPFFGNISVGYSFGGK